MLILECEQGTVFQSGANQFGLQPGQSLLGLLPGLAANQLTIGKQSLLHSGRQFYSSDPYFPQSINSVQSW